MTVSRLRSIQKACRDLRINPPNVSKILQKMERKAGARLMVRDRAGVTLTPEGIRFLKSAEQILEIAPDLNMSLRTIPSRVKPQEVVSIGSLSFVCNRLISQSLAEWYQQKPEYRFRVARMVEIGRVQKIEVQDWPTVTKNLYMTVNSERMKRSVFLMMKNEIKRQLQQASAGS